jgi:tRNA1Val (adenine37-N6)-methyltransferase
LASFATLKKRERVLDLGSGVGIIGLLLAARYPDCTVQGIEIQRRLFEFAVRNAEENRLDERVGNIRGDFRRITDYCRRASFTSVISNPPYRPLGTGRKNLDEESACARHELTGGLSDVVSAAAAVIAPGGKLFLIYSAQRTADLFGLLRSSEFEPKRLRFVHARRESPAQMVMIEARPGSGVQTVVMPPLFVWEGPGTYTDEVCRTVVGGRANSY